MSEVASRYAKAIFAIAQEKKRSEDYLEQLRKVAASLGTPGVGTFLESPMVSTEEKLKFLKEIGSDLDLSEDVLSLIAMLLKRGRVALLREISLAYQEMSDTQARIVRGIVRSAVPVGPEERKKLEQKVEKITGRKPILEYRNIEGILGGMVCEIGHLTLDDSLQTQLGLLGDTLNS